MMCLKEHYGDILCKSLANAFAEPVFLVTFCFSYTAISCVVNTLAVKVCVLYLNKIL